MSACSGGTSSFVYIREQLLACRLAKVHEEKLGIPNEIRKKYHGCRVGVKQRVKKRRYKPYVPSVIMKNVRYLVNKIDVLMALVRSQREYWECSVMCTETWLHRDILDSNATIIAFETVWAYRNRKESGKRKGGGLSVVINNRWSNPGHITMKERISTSDIELLVVGLHPYSILGSVERHEEHHLL